MKEEVDRSVNSVNDIAARFGLQSSYLTPESKRVFPREGGKASATRPSTGPLGLTMTVNPDGSSEGWSALDRGNYGEYGE